MKKIIISIFAFMAILSANDSAKEIFMNKCAVCHTMGKPNHQTAVAPPARGVMFHMNEHFSNDKEMIQDHINDFVLNPSKDKAICKSVRRFGVMPSQKGNITKEELAKVAVWMTEHLGGMTHKEHNKK
jgi:cytochrome c